MKKSRAQYSYNPIDDNLYPMQHAAFAQRTNLIKTSDFHEFLFFARVLCSSLKRRENKLLRRRNRRTRAPAHPRTRFTEKRIAL
jgi:hypothetical protein